MQVQEMADFFNELVREGHGELEVVVGYDDVPDYVQSLHPGGIGKIKEGDVTQDAVFTWYSNDGAYEDVTPVEDDQHTT